MTEIIVRPSFANNNNIITTTITKKPQIAFNVLRLRKSSKSALFYWSRFKETLIFDISKQILKVTVVSLKFLCLVVQTLILTFFLFLAHKEDSKPALPLLNHT